MNFSPNRAMLAAIGVVVAALLAGCSLNPGELASSVRSTGEGDSLTVQFANTLNLPEGSDVTFNGARVGAVTAVHLREGLVDVEAKLTDQVRIPASASASIRQNTVLGDPYVAIVGTATDRRMLESGGVIPLAQTTSPPPLEDTLAVVANFVNGGSIQNMQDVIRQINSALPSISQTQRVARIAAVDFRDLAAGTNLLDTMIRGLDTTARTVAARVPQLETMLGSGGMHYWSQLSKLFSGIGIVLPSIGSVFEGGYWLMPLLTGVNGSLTTVRNGIDAIGANQELLQKFLSDKLFPFLRRPGLEIVSASTPDGREIIGDVTKLLRMLGALR